MPQLLLLCLHWVCIFAFALRGTGVMPYYCPLISCIAKTLFAIAARMMKRFLTILLFVLLLLAIALVAIPLFFEQQAENLFIKKVNSYVSTQLLIKDEITLSLFRNFPNASLTLNSVELRESLPNSQRNLLEAKRLTFVFGWADIFRERYVVKRLIIENGKLNLRAFADGKTNYEVFANNSKQPDEQVSLQLKQVDLHEISVNYLHELYRQEAAFVLHSGNFSGNFGSTRYKMLLDADLQVQYCYLYNNNYLPDKKAVLHLDTDIDFDKNLYTFGKSTLQVAGNQFDMEGKVQFLEKISDIDLRINGVNLGATDMLTMLPANSLPESVKKLKSSGVMAFSAQVKGLYSDAQLPGITIQFNLDNGSLQHPDWSLPMQNLQLKGNFTNGYAKTRATSELIVDNLSFVVNNQSVQAKLKLNNLDAPIADGKLNGTFDLSALQKIARQYKIDNLSGQMVFDNVAVMGSIQDIYNALAVMYPTITGNIKTQNISCLYHGKPIEQINLNLLLNGQHAELQQFNLKAGNSDLAAQGQLINFIPLLFQAMGKDTIQLSQPVNINLQLTSQLLDIADLIQYLGTEPADTVNTQQQNLEITAQSQHYAVGAVQLNFQKVMRNKLEMNNLQGQIIFDDNDFVIQQLTLQLLDGTAELRGNFSVDKNRNLTLKTFISGNHLNMQQFLSDTENFGQNLLTDKNLKGNLSAKAYITAPFNAKLQLNEQAFKLIADLAIDNGQLLDFEPMTALSSFVKLSELKDVKFARLENQIEISNRKIRIPAMYIQSNVARFTLSGIHTLDNRLLYYVKLNLLDLLTGKFKKKNTTLTPDSNPNGGINLYLTMSGPANNPHIEYMKRKKVKKQFDKDAQRPKTDLEKILEQEFSLNRSLFSDSLDVETVNWADTSAIKR